jgi:hypothetical protein
MECHLKKTTDVKESHSFLFPTFLQPHKRGAVFLQMVSPDSESQKVLGLIRERTEGWTQGRLSRRKVY